MAKTKRKKPKSSSKWAIAGVGALLILMTIGFMIPPQTGNNQKQETIAPTTENDEVRGNPYAPVKIIAFSDYECDYCKDAEQTINSLLSLYPDQVSFVFRDFPISGIHVYAEKAAEASECAGEQGKFWEMHDKLFENQNALTIQDLKQYAADLGLDTAAFNTCLDSGSMNQEVVSDRTDGLNAGVEGAPTFFINGKKLVGALPLQTFQATIEEELAKVK
jgi:protein-disulfide isomerase